MRSRTRCEENCCYHSNGYPILSSPPHQRPSKQHDKLGRPQWVEPSTSGSVSLQQRCFLPNLSGGELVIGRQTGVAVVFTPFSMIGSAVEATCESSLRLQWREGAYDLLSQRSSGSPAMRLHLEVGGGQRGHGVQGVAVFSSTLKVVGDAV